MNVFQALTKLGAAVVYACVCGTVSAQPANDLCSQAQIVSVPGLGVAVTINGSTLNATSDISQTCGLSDNVDVWYSFTAPAAGLWTFDTINSILFDTSLAIYSSCGGTRLACNDDIDFANNYYWSAITMTMSLNQTVKIRVSANNSDSDIFKLNIVGADSNANNFCSTAANLTLNQPVSGTTLNATTDFAIASNLCGSFVGSRGGRDVFYAFTPAVTGPVKFSLCSSGFDTTLALLTNCSGSPASVVACNDDSASCGPTNRSELPAVALTAGVRYLIRIAGFDFEPADYGTYTLLATPLNLGVCCRGATCSFIPVQTCLPEPGSRAGLVYGSAATCNAAGIATFPCCYADYNKVNGITIQDIFDFLADWFARSGLAGFGGLGTSPPTVQHIFDFLSAWFAGGC